MMYDCTGIGICPLDHLVLVKRFPRPDTKSTAVLSEVQSGGPTSTAMTVLSRFGRKTALISSTGEDYNAIHVLDEFKKEKINLDGVRKIKGLPHPVAYIWISGKNAHRTLVLTEKLPVMKKLTTKQRGLILNSKMILIDGTEPEVGLEAAVLAKKNGIPVMLDAGSMREATRELLNLCDYIIGSQAFAQQFGKSPRGSIMAFLDKGAKIAGITSGTRGALISDGSETIHQKAFKVNAIDTTGAGDVFHGAFLEGLLQKWDLRKTTEFATAAAALKCRKLGGKKGIPDFSEVNKFLKKSPKY